MSVVRIGSLPNDFRLQTPSPHCCRSLGNAEKTTHPEPRAPVQHLTPAEQAVSVLMLRYSSLDCHFQSQGQKVLVLMLVRCRKETSQVNPSSSSPRTTRELTLRIPSARRCKSLQYEHEHENSQHHCGTRADRNMLMPSFNHANSRCPSGT